MTEAPLENPWETPSTSDSKRPDSIFQPAPSTSIDSNLSPSQNLVRDDAQNIAARIVELEAKNRYLFQRNVALVAKVAELEVSNRRLSEEMIALRKSSSTPWFLRWLGPE
jgi:hypothetical protein